MIPSRVGADPFSTWTALSLLPAFVNVSGVIRAGMSEALRRFEADLPDVDTRARACIDIRKIRLKAPHAHESAAEGLPSTQDSALRPRQGTVSQAARCAGTRPPALSLKVRDFKGGVPFPVSQKFRQK